MSVTLPAGFRRAPTAPSATTETDAESVVTLPSGFKRITPAPSETPASATAVTLPTGFKRAQAAAAPPAAPLPATIAPPATPAPVIAPPAPVSAPSEVSAPKLGLWGQTKLAGKALGGGLASAATDVFPQALAGIVRGKNVPLVDSSPIDRFIAEQQADQDRKALTEQEQGTNVFGVNAGTLEGGARNLGYSGAVMIPQAIAQAVGKRIGAPIGGAVGAAVGGPAAPATAATGAAVGGIVGGEALGMTVGYQAGKRADMNQIMRQYRDAALQANPNMTEAEWNELKQGVDAAVERHGRAEGMWEAVGNAASLGLMKLGAKWGMKIPLPKALAKPLGVIAGAAIDQPIEVGSEVLTQMDQAKAEQEMGLRPAGPPITARQALSEVGPQTIVTGALTMGIGGGVAAGVNTVASKRARAATMKDVLKARQGTIKARREMDKLGIDEGMRRRMISIERGAGTPEEKAAAMDAIINPTPPPLPGQSAPAPDPRAAQAAKDWLAAEARLEAIQQAMEDAQLSPEQVAARDAVPQPPPPEGVIPGPEAARDPFVAPEPPANAATMAGTVALPARPATTPAEANTATPPAAEPPTPAAAAPVTLPPGFKRVEPISPPADQSQPARTPPERKVDAPVPEAGKPSSQETQTPKIEKDRSERADQWLKAKSDYAEADIRGDEAAKAEAKGRMDALRGELDQIDAKRRDAAQPEASRKPGGNEAENAPLDRPARPQLYRGTTRQQWEAVQRGEQPQSEFTTGGNTWATTSLESAQGYTRAKGRDAVIIEYKDSAHDKVSKLTDDPGDQRRQGPLGLEDVQRVTDGDGNVIYEAPSAPATGKKESSGLRMEFQAAGISKEKFADQAIEGGEISVKLAKELGRESELRKQGWTDGVNAAGNPVLRKPAQPISAEQAKPLQTNPRPVPEAVTAPAPAKAQETGGDTSSKPPERAATLAVGTRIPWKNSPDPKEDVKEIEIVKLTPTVATIRWVGGTELQRLPRAAVEERLRKQPATTEPAPVVDTAKPPELMTPEEYVAFKDGNSAEGPGAMRGFYEQGYVNAVSDALKARKDVRADSVDRIFSLDQIRKSIPGYVREGDRYVFKPSPTTTPTPSKSESLRLKPIAARLGLRYDGLDEISGAHQVTDMEPGPAKGASWSVPAGATEADIIAARDAKRADFAAKAVPKASAVMPASKEPWMMTRAEAVAQGIDELVAGGMSREDAIDLGTKGFEDNHRKEVNAAVGRKEDIPAEVMADYPDLKPAKPDEGPKPEAEAPENVGRTEDSYRAEREAYGKPKTFTIKGQYQGPIGAVAIRFEPRRSKDIEAPHVKAIAIKMNGNESPASASDIGVVVGRPFFQSETMAISWPRLRMWLDGKITDEEAANGVDMLPSGRTESTQPAPASKSEALKGAAATDLFPGAKSEPPVLVRLRSELDGAQKDLEQAQTAYDDDDSRENDRAVKGIQAHVDNLIDRIKAMEQDQIRAGKPAEQQSKSDALKARAQAQAEGRKRKRNLMSNPPPGGFTDADKVRKVIGKNADGQDIEQDSLGARSVLRNGFRNTQPVRIIPGMGAGAGVLDAEDLFKSGRTEFLTVAELAEFKGEAVPVSAPLESLRDNVTGAIERGEKEAIVGKPAAITKDQDKKPEAYYKEGQRVVITESDDNGFSVKGLGGRHGVITKSSTSVMRVLFGGNVPDSYNHSYQIKTDEGHVITYSDADDFTPETEPAGEIIPDPIHPETKEPMAPGNLLHSAKSDQDSAVTQRRSAAGRRKASMRMMDQAKADAYQRKATAKLAVLRAWATEHPEQAAAVEGLNDALGGYLGRQESAAPAEAPSGVAADSGIRVTENEQHDGVEIHFPGKPSATMISAVKMHGFRWSPRQKVWYAKRNPSRLAWARSLESEGKPAAASTQVEKPETVVDSRADIVADDQSRPVPGEPGVTYSVREKFRGEKTGDANWTHKAVIKDMNRGETVPGYGFTAQGAYESALRIWREDVVGKDNAAAKTPTTVKDRNGESMSVGERVYLMSGLGATIGQINQDGTVSLSGVQMDEAERTKFNPYNLRKRMPTAPESSVKPNSQPWDDILDVLSERPEVMNAARNTPGTLIHAARKAVMDAWGTFIGNMAPHARKPEYSGVIAFIQKAGNKHEDLDANTERWAKQVADNAASEVEAGGPQDDWRENIFKARDYALKLGMSGPVAPGQVSGSNPISRDTWTNREMLVAAIDAHLKTKATAAAFIAGGRGAVLPNAPAPKATEADVAAMSDDDIDALLDDAKAEAFPTQDKSLKEPPVLTPPAPGTAVPTEAQRATLKELLGKIEDGAAIIFGVGSTDFGLPGTGWPSSVGLTVNHLGYGAFEGVKDGKKLYFDGGGLMQSNDDRSLSWTLIDGPADEMGYPRASVIARLKELTKAASKSDALRGQPTAAAQAKQNLKDAGKHAGEAFDAAAQAIRDILGGGGRLGMGIPIDFDAETYAKVKPHLKTMWESSKAVGHDLKQFAVNAYKALGEAAKPYLKRFMDELKTQASSTPQAAKTPHEELANGIAAMLSHSGTTIDNPTLQSMADEVFKGSRGAGTYNPRDAYDAMEAGVNRYIEQSGIVDFADPIGTMARLRELISRLPRQTDRTERQVEFQQFSTPPEEAFLVAYAAGIKPGMVVVEPSAGTGDIAVMARIAGARVIVNEIDPVRAGLLRAQGFETYTVDAELLDGMLPQDVKPDIIVMNPPFSATGGRVASHDTAFGGRHVKQALLRVNKGGRVVSVVGTGMAHGKPKMDSWWQEIEGKFTVRANVGIDGASYGKYGTTFDNNILVIDKTGPTPGLTRAEKIENIIRGEGQSPADALSMLTPLAKEDINERLEQSGKPSDTTGVQDATGTPPIPPGSTPGVGAGARPGNRGGASGTRGGARSGVQSPGNRGPNGATGVGTGRTSDTGNTTGTEQVGGQPGAADANVNPQNAGRTGESTRAAGADVEGTPYSKYVVRKAIFSGSKAHPATMVESTALATVEPPDLSYQVSLPPEVISEGRISDVQLEAVAYAGQRHEQLLPDGSRAEFWVADGTGAGKTRIIIGTIFDNFLKGRKKAIVISANHDLASQFEADMKAVGIPMKMVKQADFKESTKDANKKVSAVSIPKNDGVFFTAYSLLAQKYKTTKPRIAQMTEWAGKDFDGVIVFDEAHKMKNAVGSNRGGRASSSSGTDRGLMGLELKRMFPKARILNMSATGATTPRNMGYLSRMGLWGHGSAFRDFLEFLQAMADGGLGAMEMLTRDLKAVGAFVSRTISYKGDTPEQTVSYRKLEHKVEDDQRQQYDRAADLWADLLKAFEEAGANANMTTAQTNARLRQFYGSQQRFFLQMMVSYQLPSLLKDADLQLAAGHQVIVSLYHTNEGMTKDLVDKARADGEDLDNLDFTPRNMLVNLIDSQFPVEEYQEIQDPNSSDPDATITVPVMDAAGNPVLNRENLEKRDALKAQIGNLNLPDNPLDAIVKHFGPKKIAEITGRKARIEGGRLVKRTVDDTRKKDINLKERELFQKGVKKVAVISGAAAEGIDLHADKKVPNHNKRVFYAMELSWSADQQMQSFGRPHRAFQTKAPEIVLVHTDIASQQRLINTIERRLASLGALSKGGREALTGGLFNIEDLTDDYGQAALSNLWSWMHTNKRAALERMNVLNADGNVKDSADDPEKFLNRIMVLPIAEQNEVFERFYSTYQSLVAAAKENGTFDTGVEQLKERHMRRIGDVQTVYTHPGSKAKTSVVEIHGEVRQVTVPFYGDINRPWDDSASGMARNGNGSSIYHQSHDDNGFYRNKRSGKIYAAAAKTRGGEFDLLNPKGDKHDVWNSDLTDEDKYEKITEGSAERLWNAELSEVPQWKTRKHFLITGAVFPIYDKVFHSAQTGQGAQHTRSKIMRVALDNGESYIGIDIDERDILGVKQRLGIGAALADATPGEIFDLVMDNNAIVELDNGWRLKKSMVHYEPRLELVWGTRLPNSAQMEKMGVIAEQIDWKNRYFVPNERDAAEPVLTELLGQYKAIRDVTSATGGKPQYRTTPAPQAAATKSDELKARAAIRRILGQDAPVEIVDRIFERGANRLGKYQAGLTTIARGGDMERTAFHEAYHGAEDMLFTDDERARAEAIEPDSERRADAFMRYAYENRGFLGRLKGLFDRLMFRVKALFGAAGKLDELRAIHARLMGGSVAGREASVEPGVLQAANATVTAPGAGPQFMVQAYHGTPHTYEPEEGAPFGRVKKDKVGTGEGAAAYGWGVLYTAENQDVAVDYRDRLGKGRRAWEERVLINGKQMPYVFKGILPHVDSILETFVREGKEKAIRVANRSLDSISLSDPKKRTSVENIKRDIQNGVITVDENPGNIYHIEIDADPEHFLDWDKALTDQSEYVKAALGDFAIQGIGKPRDVDGGWRVDIGRVFHNFSTKEDAQAWIDKRNTAIMTDRTATGGALYDQVAEFRNSKQIASEMLAARGIKGIRYADQGSRANNFKVEKGLGGRWWVTDRLRNEITDFDTEQDAREFVKQSNGGPTYNYVVFNEGDIRVVGRNGETITPTEAMGAQYRTDDAMTDRERTLATGMTGGASLGRAEQARQTTAMLERFKAKVEQARQKATQKAEGATQAIRDDLAKAVTDHGAPKAAAAISEGRMGIRAAIARLSSAAEKNGRVSTRNELKAIKQEIVRLTREKLPRGEWGRMLLDVAKAKNDADLIRAAKKIDAAAGDIHKRNLIGAIKTIFERSADSMRVDVTYRRRIKDLMAGFLMTKPSEETLAKARELADFLESERNSGSDMDLTLNRHMAKLLRQLAGTPLRDLAVPELEDLLKQLGRLATIGRLYQQGKDTMLRHMKDDDLASVENSTKLNDPVQITPDALGGKLTLGEKLKNRLAVASDALRMWYVYHQPMDVVFDLLDGAKHYAGANYRLFKARLDNAFSGFRSEMVPLEGELGEMVKRYGIDKAKAERVGVYAIDQQATGRQKILNTFSNGTPEDDARVNAMVDAMELTPDEMAFYEWMRGKLDAIRPAIERVMKETYNAEMDQVEHYFPFITDWNLMDVSHDFYGLEQDDTGAWVKTKADTGLKKNVAQGFTMNRRGAGGQKVKVDALRAFHKHMQDVNYYIHVGPTVKYLQEIATDERYRAAVGSTGQRIVREYLDTMARQGGMGGSHILRWVDALRNNIGVGTLGFRLSSMLIQPSSWFDGAGMIGGRWATKGALDITDKKWHAFMYDNMTEIRDRLGDDWAFGEADLKSKLAKYGFWPLQMLDKAAAGAIAAGAYEKNLHERGMDVDFSRPDAEALAYAQRIVRRTQASPSYKDQPLAISRGALMGGSRTLARALYQFQTFTLNKFSYLMHDGLYSSIKNKEPHAGLAILAWSTAAFMFEEAVRLGLRAAPGGRGNDDDDLEEFAKNVAMDYVQTIPWVGSVVSALQYNRFPAPVVSAIAEAASGIKSAVTAKSGSARLRGAVRSAGAIGSMAGIPGTSQAAQWARNSIKSPTEEVGAMIQDDAKRLPRSASAGMIRAHAQSVYRKAAAQGLVERGKPMPSSFYARYYAAHKRLMDR